MFSNLFGIGQDAVLRYTTGGKPVCGLSLAYDVGFGDNKRTVWIDASLWGDRAEKLVGYLTKGTKVFAVLDDIELEQYQKNNGDAGAKIKGRVVDIKFAGGQQQQGQQAAPQQQQVRQQQQAQGQQAQQQQAPQQGQRPQKGQLDPPSLSEMDDFEDIPF